MLKTALRSLLRAGHKRVFGTQSTRARFCILPVFFICVSVQISPQSKLLLRRQIIPPNGAACIAASPDGKFLAAGGNDFNVHVIHAKDGSVHAAFEGHTDIVRALAFSPARGGMLASGSMDKSIRLWSTERGVLSAVLSGHTGYIFAVAFSPDGALLASGGSDGTIRIWDTKNFACRKVLHAHEYSVNTLAFSPDGKLLGSGGLDEKIRLWNTADWSLRKEFNGRSNSVRHLAFSKDGTMLASANFKHTVRLWRIRDAACVETFAVEKNTQVNDCVFSPDGKRILCALSSGGIHQWKISNAKNGFGLQAHGGKALALAFSADKKRLYSCGEDLTIASWDAGKLAAVKMKPEKKPRKHKAVKAKSKRGKAYAHKKKTVRTGRQTRR